MTENKREMTREVMEVYEPLYQEVCWLHAKWKIFRQLYAAGTENVNLMNASAPTFFRMFQNVSMNDILLTISRLTDPERTFRTDNLSLEQLVRRVDAVAHPGLSAELLQILAVAINECSFARTVRHKRIAHNDLLLKIKANVEPLPRVNVEKIEAAIGAIRRVMNRIEEYFQNIPVTYEAIALMDDGDGVLSRLREARQYRQHRRDRDSEA
jgi:hypothetical protein